jgi:Fe2+ or Zn2+ uptake regulation protein
MEEVFINIFFAYSREDQVLRHRLDKHLSGLRRKDYIKTWYDGRIEPGKEWKMEIDTNLSKSDIILLLISADFIDSDYCYNIEMKKAIIRHEKGDAVVIPIILNHCDWDDLPFSKIQGLPQSGNPITSNYWENADIAFTEIAKSIKDIVENLLKNKRKHLKSIHEGKFDKQTLRNEILDHQKIQNRLDSKHFGIYEYEYTLTQLSIVFKMLNVAQNGYSITNIQDLLKTKNRRDVVNSLNILNQKGIIAKFNVGSNSLYHITEQGIELCKEINIILANSGKS